MGKLNLLTIRKELKREEKKICKWEGNKQHSELENLF
jgi:hypothetical protein